MFDIYHTELCIAFVLSLQLRKAFFILPHTQWERIISHIDSFRSLYEIIHICTAVVEESEE